MSATTETRSETTFFPSRQRMERLEGKSVVVLDVDEATGRPRLVAVVPVAPEMRNGLFVANNPVNAIDPLGLYNPTKGAVAMLNYANAGRLYVGGAGKLLGAAGLIPTGAGAPAGLGAAALGTWNFKSAGAAANAANQQYSEALCEDFGDADFKNLLGVLPFGTEFDDPGEPSLWNVYKGKSQKFTEKPWEAIQEIGRWML